MTITLTWQRFKEAVPYSGGRLLYVANNADKVTKVAVTSWSGNLFSFSNPLPTRAEFLILYPNAWEVDNLNA